MSSHEDLREVREVHDEARVHDEEEVHDMVRVHGVQDVEVDGKRRQRDVCIVFGELSMFEVVIG